MQLLNISFCGTKVKNHTLLGALILSTYILHVLVSDKGLNVHLLLIYIKVPNQTVALLPPALNHKKLNYLLQNALKMLNIYKKN
jgi:hypothetical protein